MLLNILSLNVMMQFFRQRKVWAIKNKEVYEPQSVLRLSKKSFYYIWKSNN